MLDRDQVANVAAYVYSLTNPVYSTPQNIDTIKAGPGGLPDAPARPATARTPRATGRSERPNLTDPYWIYGGDLDTIITSVHGGRQGHMPTWDERLTTAEIRTLALYVYDLGTRAAMTGRTRGLASTADGFPGVWLLIPAGLLLFAGANAHLVYVAFHRSRTASST